MTEPTVDWVHFKGNEGCRYSGKHKYLPSKPWGKWEKILGVVARCEGGHDTFFNADGTGGSWGFQQWTFTSGRLQNLLNSFKAIILENKKSLFDECFGTNGAEFVKFGFNIQNGQFLDCHTGKVVIPNSVPEKQHISDLCMGKLGHEGYKTPKDFAIALAKLFIKAGEREDVAKAQIDFAIKEFEQALKPKRSPLGDVETLDKLLAGTWETCIPGLFFNLWQNSPGAAYKLFIPSYKFAKGGSKKYLDDVWLRLNKSQFANWSFAKPENTSPRIVRIKNAIREFYDLDLPIVRK